MKTRDIVFIALFAAIMAILGVFPPLMIPVTGIPITAQSLGPMLAGGVLGAKRGGLAIALFVALVAIGLPLLPGGRGGLGVFFGPGGGFILGWILAAVVVGAMVEYFWSRLTVVRALCATVVGGILVLYIAGIPWSAFVAKMPLSAATMASVPFLLGDCVKAVLAALVIVSVKRSYPLMK